MNLPQTVTAADLQALAAPDEKLAVRIIARRIVNTGPYTMRGARRRYLLIRDASLASHIIDIPLSLWMAGVPEGPYVDNLSVAHDIQAARVALKSPLVYLVVPWKHAKQEIPQDERSNPLATFKKLAEKTGAPPIIMSGIDLLASDLKPEEVEAALLEAIDRVDASAPEEPATVGEARPADESGKPPPQSNAKRQKAYRARKAAAKKAAKTP